jgi:solute:Na+ symporter, SSS family
LDKALIVAICTALYLGITTLVGMWSVRHTKDTASFMTAKNQMGPLMMGVLLMSEFIGTSSTIGTAQAGFEKGLAVAWNVATLSLGFLLYAYILAPKINASGEYTISGLLGSRFGNAVRIIVSITMAFALTTVNVAVYTGGATTVGVLLQVPMQIAIWIIGVAAALSVAFGGLRGVGYANVIHATAKYLCLLLILGTGWFILQDKPELWAKIPDTHFSFVGGVGVPQLISWTIGNIGAVFCTQFVLQSVASMPTPAQAKKAALVASVTILPIGFIAAYIGIFARAIFPDISSVMALSTFFTVMNKWLVGISAAGIIAATFVTILACILGATALVMKDFYIPWVKPGEKHKILATRFVSVIIGLMPIPFALYVPGMIKTIFFARALRTSITVVLLFMFFLPHMASKTGATIGLACSIALTIIWFALGNPWGIDNMYIAVATPALVMVLDNIYHRFIKSSPKPIADEATTELD